MQNAQCVCERSYQRNQAPELCRFLVIDFAETRSQGSCDMSLGQGRPEVQDVFSLKTCSLRPRARTPTPALMKVFMDAWESLVEIKDSVSVVRSGMVRDTEFE